MYVIKGGGVEGERERGVIRGPSQIFLHTKRSLRVCVCIAFKNCFLYFFHFLFFSFSMFYDYATLPRARALAASEVEDDETETAGAVEARAAVRFFPSSRFVQSDVKIRKNSVFI